MWTFKFEDNDLVVSVSHLVKRRIQEFLMKTYTERRQWTPCRAERSLQSWGKQTAWKIEHVANVEQFLYCYVNYFLDPNWEIYIWTFSSLKYS